MDILRGCLKCSSIEEDTPLHSVSSKDVHEYIAAVLQSAPFPVIDL